MSKVLILTRKCNESIRIGDDITITMMRVDAGQVRIGIDAPRGVPVHREEVYERIQAENREAAQARPTDLNQLVERLRTPELGGVPQVTAEAKPSDPA